MKFTHLGRTAVIAVAGALLLSSCAANEGGSGTDSGSGDGSSLTGTLNGAGASSAGAAQEAWIAAFQTANPDVTVNYDPSGSGAGRETFTAGGVDFAGSDAFLSDEELGATFEACAPDTAAIDVPIYVSPVAVIFNVEGVESLKLDAATIAGIFSGAITTWDDAAIADQNPDATLPAETINTVHRSDESGTTENFAEYLSANAPDVWTAEADKVWPFEGGEGAQGTSGVVSAVTNGVNTIGYADASQAGDLGTVEIKVGDAYVPFSPEAAAAVVDASPMVEGRGEGDLAFEIDRTTTAEGVYPLVLVSYAVICGEYADAAQGELVKAYIEYIASAEGQQVAADAAGAAPLSDEIAQQVADSLANVK